VNEFVSPSLARRMMFSRRSRDEVILATPDPGVETPG
jgi:hypothetical protein